MSRKAGILIIVENLTVPLDRRVWQEARTLQEAGYTVSIVCPKGGKYTKSYEVLEGIHIFRHPLPIEADGALGYALEYSWALAWEFALSVKAYWKVGFDAVQACNPPDLLFLIGGFWKYLFGKRFVFDHHDINPELYEAKFNKQGRLPQAAVVAGAADVQDGRRLDRHQRNVQGHRHRARRHGCQSRLYRALGAGYAALQAHGARLNLKNGRKHLAGYVGIMGAQDGVDLLDRGDA